MKKKRALREHYEAADHSREVEALLPNAVEFIHTLLKDTAEARIHKSPETQSGSMVHIEYIPGLPMEEHATAYSRGIKVMNRDPPQAADASVVAAFHLVFNELMEKENFRASSKGIVAGTHVFDYAADCELLSTQTFIIESPVEPEILKQALIRCATSENFTDTCKAALAQAVEATHEMRTEQERQGMHVRSVTLDVTRILRAVKTPVKITILASKGALQEAMAQMVEEAEQESESHTTQHAFDTLDPNGKVH